jgi:4-diphosphocytidyl-2-C-methyl-D-erythritol kinase
MTALRDTAKAKLNLTLEVLGRRADGYHEIRSLVAFAELADSVELEPDEDLALIVAGRFADALQSDNLITAAAEAAKDAAPRITLGLFRLVKALPVAAGLGGGSADAAAALRLLARANPTALTSDVVADIAVRLGSDVTVCLKSKPALMTGCGERVTPVRGFPPCAVVLVNPRLPLPTASVYGALNAPPFPGRSSEAAEFLDFGESFERLIGYATPRGNDLEAAALRLVPVIGEVLTTLKSIDGARFVRIAGSGPTCYALLATEAEAKAAADGLMAAHPNWWVASTTL